MWLGHARGKTTLSCFRLLTDYATHQFIFAYVLYQMNLDLSISNQSNFTFIFLLNSDECCDIMFLLRIWSFFMDINSLDRFLEAQERVYDIALQEIKDGRKRSHWMWFIFPQLRNLGRSRMAHFYGISDISEAREYLAHPILGKRLIRICQVLLLIEGKTAEEIFGGIDAIKLRSSMTLFSLVDGEESVFHRLLDKFYGGEPDPLTLALVKK